MKLAVLTGLLVAVGLACFIDKRSDDFTCQVDADCLKLGTDIDRECNIDNVCVEVSCPSRCDSCAAGKICNVSCNSPTECSSGYDCPDGYNCRISCSRNCTPVDCSEAASCIVTCSGNNTTCGPLNCGAATPCTCMATNGTCL